MAQGMGAGEQQTCKMCVCVCVRVCECVCECARARVGALLHIPISKVRWIVRSSTLILQAISLSH